MPNTAPSDQCGRGHERRVAEADIVMALPVATVVPTVDAKPHTMAGRTSSSLIFDA